MEDNLRLQKAGLSIHFWRMCLGESDVRYYILQSVVSQASECQWVGQHLQCLMYRYVLYSSKTPHGEEEEAFIQGRNGGPHYQALIRDQAYRKHHLFTSSEDSAYMSSHLPSYGERSQEKYTDAEVRHFSQQTVQKIHQRHFSSKKKPKGQLLGKQAARKSKGAKVPEKKTALVSSRSDSWKEPTPSQIPRIWMDFADTPVLDDAGNEVDTGARFLHDWEVHRRYSHTWRSKFLQCFDAWRRGERANAACNYQLVNHRNSEFHKALTGEATTARQQCPDKPIMIITLLGPSPAGKSSHYVTLVADKSWLGETGKTIVYLVDSGRCSRDAYPKVRLPKGCRVSKHQPVKEHQDDTWNEHDINELLVNLRGLEDVIVVERKTHVPIQLDYGNFIPYEDPTYKQDMWCQTWSFAFGLLMIYPSFVDQVHQVMVRKDVLQELFTPSQAKCITMVVEKLLIPRRPGSTNAISDFVNNIEWFQRYFDYLMAITTQKIPVLNTLWLYAFIYCLYPYLQNYLLQPNRGSSLTVSQVLNGQAEIILSDQHIDPTIRQLFTVDNIHRLSLARWYQEFSTIENINHIPKYF